MKLYKHEYAKIIRKNFSNVPEFTPAQLADVIMNDPALCDKNRDRRMYHTLCSQMLMKLSEEEDPLVKRNRRGWYRVYRTRKTTTAITNTKIVNDTDPLDLSAHISDKTSQVDVSTIIENPAIENPAIENPAIETDGQYEFDFSVDPLQDIRTDMFNLKRGLIDNKRSAENRLKQKTGEYDSLHTNLSMYKAKVSDLSRLFNEIQNIRISESHSCNLKLSFKDITGIDISADYPAFTQSLLNLYQDEISALERDLHSIRWAMQKTRDRISMMETNLKRLYDINARIGSNPHGYLNGEDFMSDKEFLYSNRRYAGIL